VAAGDKCLADHERPAIIRGRIAYQPSSSSLRSAAASDEGGSVALGVAHLMIANIVVAAQNHGSECGKAVAISED
jgi:hypothetical protein